ncbi:MAG: hypothetical protein R3A44_35115 [Caldilineaceae bacterium]
MAGSKTKKIGKKKKRARSPSPERSSVREGTNRMVLGRQRTVGPITYSSTTELLKDLTKLPTGSSVVAPSWKVGAPSGILKTYTDDDMDEAHDGERRRTLINLKSGDLNRKPTFYSEVFHTGGGKNDGKPQGPHTVAHAFNELMVEGLKESNKSKEPDGIRAAFLALLRSSTEVEEFVKKIMPSYETDLTASGVRAAAELYQIEYGRMINKLNKVTAADTDDISALYTEISSLMNLDPASTYGWDQATPFSKASKELAGKGEAAGISWLQRAKGIYDVGTTSADEKARQTLQMARALTRLLDLPSGLSGDFSAAVKELQDKRLKLFFNDDTLVKDIRDLFDNQKFKDWIDADQRMWQISNKKKPGPTDIANMARAAIDSQTKYHALQTDLKWTPSGSINLPSQLSVSNNTRDTFLKAKLGATEFAKLKAIG